MIRICTGTAKFKGCGFKGFDVDFSASYKNMCLECANEYKRIQYQKREHPQQEGTAIYNEFALKPWRKENVSTSK